jgi:hypothetical protein
MRHAALKLELEAGQGKHHMPRKWPQEHDDELRRLHGEGLSFAEIANKISSRFRFYYTRNACIGRALRIGLTKNVREVLRDRTRAAIRCEEAKAIQRQMRGEANTAAEPPPRRRRRYKVVQPFEAAPQDLIEATGLPHVKRSTIPAGSTASRVISAIKKKTREFGDANIIDTRPMRCVEIEPLNLSIMDLTENTCRWPAGGYPDDTPITFCGHWCPKEVPYCFDHQRLSIGIGTPSERSAHRLSTTADAA